MSQNIQANDSTSNTENPSNEERSFKESVQKLNNKTQKEDDNSIVLTLISQVKYQILFISFRMNQGFV